MIRRSLAALALAACGDDGGHVHDVDAPNPDDVATTPHLDPTPGTYRQTCDGSGAIALDAMHFLDVNDEDQVARVYLRGADGGPIQTFDLNPGLGTQANGEADLEDVVRVGNRVYFITSHARRTSGNLDRARYHFAAFDLAGSAPNFTLTPGGSTGLLLDQMLDSANWDVPNATIINALTTASKLSSASEPTLAPESMGTNIEALARGDNGQLLIGFRNPHPGGAIVVALANPDAVVTGQTARFAWGALVPLANDQGLRAMAYSDALASYWLIGGPSGGAGTFTLYQLASAMGTPTQRESIPSTLGSPEAIVPYAGTADIQVVIDMGDANVGGVSCKDAAASARSFRDQIIRVD
jgi:hypothetical protein